MSKNNRVWRLQERPVGVITNNALSLEKENIPQPKDGECLFQLNYLSLDPTNRIWMSDETQYMPPVALGEPMRGVVCGTVLESMTPAFKKGDIVSGIGTWSDYQIGSPESVGLLSEVDNVSVMDAFATLALVGPSAYFCLLDIGAPKAGETIVVSTAARRCWINCWPIARSKLSCSWITGSDENVDGSRELGLMSYHYKLQIADALSKAVPMVLIYILIMWRHYS